MNVITNRAPIIMGGLFPVKQPNHIVARELLRHFKTIESHDLNGPIEENTLARISYRARDISHSLSLIFRTDSIDAFNMAKMQKRCRVLGQFLLPLVAENERKEFDSYGPLNVDDTNTLVKDELMTSKARQFFLWDIFYLVIKEQHFDAAASLLVQIFKQNWIGDDAAPFGRKHWMSLVLNRIEDRVQNEGAISPPMLRMLLNVLKATSPVFRESCIQNYLTYFVNRNLLVVSEEERDALLGDRLQEILDDPEMDPSEGAHWLWRDVSHHSECTEGKITRLVYNGADINKLKGALDERAADHHKSLISHKDKVEIVQAKVESLKKAADAAKVKRDAVVEELTFKRQAAVDNATPLGRDPITIIAEYFKPTRREIVDLCYAQQG